MIKKIKHFQRQKNNIDGFSLIELVVAVGVLAILSAVGVVAYSKNTENAREAAVQAAATDVLAGAVAYYSNGGDPNKAAEEWTNSAQKDKNGDPVIDIVLKVDDENCLTVNAEYVGYGNKAVRQTGKNCVGTNDSDNDDSDDNKNSGVIVGNEDYGSFYFEIVNSDISPIYTVDVVRLDTNEKVFTNTGVSRGSYEYFNFDLTDVKGDETIRISGEIAGIPYSIVREVDEFLDPEISYGSIKVMIINDDFLYFYDEDTGENINNEYISDDESEEEVVGAVNIDHSLSVDLNYSSIPDNCRIELYNLRTDEVIGSVESCDANDNSHYYEFTENALYEDYEGRFNAYPFELRMYVDDELNSTIDPYYMDTMGSLLKDGNVITGDLRSDISLVWLEDEQKFVNVWVGVDLEPNYNVPLDPNKIGSEIF